MAEGNSFTNLLKLMKTQGYNKDNNITIGKVVSTSPLTVELDSFTITEGDFFIAERLTEHTRDIEIDAISLDGVTDYDVPEIPHHNHLLKPFKITQGTLTIKNPLKPGDFVLVIIDENDFFIIDKVVS